MNNYDTELGDYLARKQIPRSVFETVFKYDVDELTPEQRARFLGVLKACEMIDPVEAELTYLKLLEKYQ
jgi:hypothetical protein